MAQQPVRDLNVSVDDQECRTVVLDLGDGPGKKHAPMDGEATVVLDLSPTQVHDMLTNAKEPGTKPAKD